MRSQRGVFVPNSSPVSCSAPLHHVPPTKCQPPPTTHSHLQLLGPLPPRSLPDERVPDPAAMNGLSQSVCWPNRMASRFGTYLTHASLASSACTDSRGATSSDRP